MQLAARFLLLALAPAAARGGPAAPLDASLRADAGCDGACAAAGGEAVELLQRASSRKRAGAGDAAVDGLFAWGLNSDLNTDHGEKLREGTQVVDGRKVETYQGVQMPCERIGGKDSAFGLSNVISNNLQGRGPDPAAPGIIRYALTGQVMGRPLDLVVEALTPYQPHNTFLNGMRNNFGTVNLQAGSSVNLQVKLVDAETGTAARLEHFYFTLFDLDDTDGGHGEDSPPEEFMLNGYANYHTTEDTHAMIEEVGGLTVLRFKRAPAEEGSGPENYQTMTATQSRRAVTFEFKNFTSFELGFAVRNTARNGGRNMEFAGWSPLALCPSNAQSDEQFHCGLLPLMVSLDEAGYRSILNAPSVCVRNDTAAFIRRTIAHQGLHVKNEGGMEGFAKTAGCTFAKKPSSQPIFEPLMQELKLSATMPSACGGGWVAIDGSAPRREKPLPPDFTAADVGYTAALNEEGFQTVAATNSVPKMEAFVRRVVDQKLYIITSEADFLGFVPFYTQQCGRKTFEGLVQELSDIAYRLSCTCKGSWLDPQSSTILQGR